MNRSVAVRVLLLGLATVMLVGCQPFVRVAGPRGPVYEPLPRYVVRMDFMPRKPSADAGKKVYDARCAVCHGPQGRGNGPMARDLTAPEKNLYTDFLSFFRIHPKGEPLPSRPANFANLDQMRLNTPFSMFETVARGRPHTAMPGFQHPAYGAVDGGTPRLSDQEIWDVVFWEWSRTTSRQRLQLGRRVYQQKCAECHGALGDGKGPRAEEFREMVWTWARGVGPGIFTDREWMAYRKPTELYQRIVEGVERRGLRLMPAYRDELRPEEIWAVVDYLWTFVYEPPADLR
ncbi:MAG: c-type cytochrome [Armatimonadota bacterium]|nr:c-type cytochrome [Armatimonadota bacterium]MDR7439050.1 c-type cytochrome [Armatimonadota bacterium]MDR7563013.1 c-type cytochrome [Armatimonadota bacterium]